MVVLESLNLRLRHLDVINPWVFTGLIIIALFLTPILAVFAAASGDSGGLWHHLFETVLPRYVLNTLVLMLGVAVVTLIFGVSSAWIVVRYDFKGRNWLQWMLLLPAAVPAYLIAYTYTDFLEYAGPFQVLLRELFEYQSARDYWFPEIRSIPGAILVMGSVLYPYVYMMARIAFQITPASLYEVGRLSRRSLFWAIAIPLSRPAIAAGLALVLMETISDFGTVDYFAIETLTLGIFNVWLGMNNLTAAAQISSVAFLFILALVILEMMARARRRFSDTTRYSVSLPPLRIGGSRALICWCICSFPIILGFFIPVAILLSFVLEGVSLGFNTDVVIAARNSITIAAIVAILVIGFAAFLAFVGTYIGNATFRQFTAAASIGYAFPGTILAIGVVTVGGAVDDLISLVLSRLGGLGYDGWLTSGWVLVIFACVIRFQAIGYGAIQAGLERLPENMMNANRMLGYGFWHGLREVVSPLIRLSLVAGALLVFVDVMKELPMTLLLRPFNFETLPTYVYQFAKDELLEEAALPALAIIAVGIIPVIIMNALLNRFGQK